MGKKTVYLDSSTLIHAIESREKDRRGWLLLEAVAQNAQLVLSFAHLIELFDRVEKSEALRRAQWFDALNPVYIAPWEQILQYELKGLLFYANEVAPPERKLFHRNLIMQFADTWEVKHYEDLLRRGSNLLAFVDDVHSPQGKAVYERFYRLPQKIKVLLDDARSNPQYLTNTKQGRRVRLEKYCERISRELNEIWKHRNSNLDEKEFEILCSKKTMGGLYVVSIEQEEKKIIVTPKDLRKAPMAYMVCEYQHNMTHDLVSEGVTDPMKAASSDPADILHLVGASYCDFFSCDNKTRDRLKRSWQVVGRRRPYVLKKNRAESFASHEDLLEGMLLTLDQEDGLNSDAPSTPASAAQAHRLDPRADQYLDRTQRQDPEA